MNKIIRRNLNCVLSIFVCLSNMQMVYAEEYIPEEQEEENEVSAAETEVIEETIEEEVVVKSYDEAYGDFTYTVKNNAVTITGYTGSDTSITIPGEIDGNPVTNISYYAFRNHTELTKVVFEENLENIYTGAFQGCTNLKEVTFPDSLTFIENDGFKDCPIENLQLPKNINKLGFDSFSNNPNLTSIYLPASLSSVSDGSPFKGCENLKEIYFEEGFKSIPNYLFDGTLIEEIELPEGIESTGMYSFRNCEKLTKVIFPSTIKQIDSHSFENDISLQQITLNDGLKTIWSYAFAGCVNLKQVRFPETITYIDCMAFNSCPFEDLVLPAKIVNLNYACFGDNPNLTSVFIPSTLASCWGHSPFTGCENLQEVLFEEGTVKIPDRLFQSAMIEKIVIPEGIETIGEYAFKNCENLKEVQFPSTLKMIDMYAFEEDPALEEIVLNEGLEEIEYYGFKYTKKPYRPK